MTPYKFHEVIILDSKTKFSPAASSGYFCVMISFDEFELNNGLQVIVHQDPHSPVVCLNLLYKVGSRNEDPKKTGFAHLFEHLMFGGSENIPDFDTPLQSVGGDNNAFTSLDITNYYCTVPADNVETAFWLESDRMMGLSFDPKVLAVQKKVVVEEFKQRYLNQPYGDVWLKLRPAAYKVHPYRWPTIGMEPSHIEQVTMDDVKDFFYKHYGPNNAILALSGDITLSQAKALAEKWFGPIPAINLPSDEIEGEPIQNGARSISVTAEVPSDTFYQVFHMPGRMAPGYHEVDLFSDLLGRGKSSYLYHDLVKSQELFRSISCYVTGTVDPGLIVISGKLSDKVSLPRAEEVIADLLEGIWVKGIKEKDLERVKNQSEFAVAYSELDVQSKALNLAYSAFLGNTNLVNEELERIKKIRGEDILYQAKEVFNKNRSTTLYYKKAS